MMWQDDFRTSNISVEEVILNSKAETLNFFSSRGIVDGHLILLRPKVDKTDIFITDEFEGVLFQEGFSSFHEKTVQICHFIQEKFKKLVKGNPNDQNSAACTEEKNSVNANVSYACGYWQTCTFSAIKIEECEIPVDFFHVLIVASIVFLLAALFSIFCFIKKRQTTQQQIADINYRLPHVFIDTTNPAENQNEVILNDATPGLCFRVFLIQS